MAIGLSMPFIMFWVLLVLAREELGLKGIAITVLIWTGLLLGCILLPPAHVHAGYIFAGLQALLDAILIIVIFGRDIHIR